MIRVGEPVKRFRLCCAFNLKRNVSMEELKRIFSAKPLRTEREERDEEL
jgi:hypothetical protein